MTTQTLDPDTVSTTLSRAWWRATGLILACAIAWDTSGLDMSVMTWLGNASGFPLRGNWWLETVLHDAARRVAILLYLAMWVTVWRPVSFLRQFQRIERLEAALGVTVALLAVNAIKRYSQTSCPWELQAFGGAATYVSHWEWGLNDGGGGMCFPGGHASSALAFLALALPGLMALPGSHAYRSAKRLMTAVLLTGAVLGAAQTLRGAHYPSHTLWTAWVCWVVAGCVRVILGQWRGWRAPTKWQAKASATSGE